MTYVLVIYDISGNKRRIEVADRLKAMGYVRIQRSAYITKGGAATAKDTARALMRIIDPKTDSVVIFIIDAYAYSRAIRLGANAEVDLDQSIVMI